MGGYDSKEEIDRFNRLADMEENSRNSRLQTRSSISGKEETDSSSTRTVPSDVVRADDGCGKKGTDVRQSCSRKEVVQLRKKAMMRISAWHADTWANGTDPSPEWEWLDVDAWAIVTGYGEVDKEVEVTCERGGRVTTTLSS